METIAKLGAKAIGRRGMKNVEGYELKERQRVGSSCPVVARRAKQDVGSQPEASPEAQSPYNRVFDPEKSDLRFKNDHLWHVS